MHLLLRHNVRPIKNFLARELLRKLWIGGLRSAAALVKSPDRLCLLLCFDPVIMPQQLLRQCAAFPVIVCTVSVCICLNVLCISKYQPPRLTSDSQPPVFREEGACPVQIGVTDIAASFLIILHSYCICCWNTLSYSQTIVDCIRGELDPNAMQPIMVFLLRYQSHLCTNRLFPPVLYHNSTAPRKR